MYAPIDYRQFFGGARVWIVAGRGEFEVADELRRRLAEFGAAAEITSFAVQRYRKLDPHGSHFVLVLPATQVGATRPGRIPAAISALRCAVSAAEHSTLLFVQLGDGRLPTVGFTLESGDYVAAFAKGLRRKRRDMKVRVVHLSTAFSTAAAAELLLGQLVGAGNFACAGLSHPGPAAAMLPQGIAASGTAACLTPRETFLAHTLRTVTETCLLCRDVARWSWRTLISEIQGFCRHHLPPRVTSG
ncbi:MAG TPA: hypothetical protein VFI31_17505 [Pirellulales bacterium]|nr:hypothetical protein [Pirellulales bacterium]